MEECPLTPEEIRAFEARLQQTLAQLEGDLSVERVEARAAATSSASEGVVDRGEESFADSSAEVGRAIVDRHEDERRSILLALARVRDGSYGTCARCGEPIAIERLHAYPAASRCMSCQQRAENR